MIENDTQSTKIFNSPEISYEEMALWRDICEHLNGIKYKTLCAGDSPSIPNFSQRGGWELVGIERDRRDALWKFHDCQINLVVWYQDRYDSDFKGWKVAKDWYRKIDWLEKVIVLNRDPQTLAKPWIVEREKREKEERLKNLLFNYSSSLYHVNSFLSSINKIMEKINRAEDRKFRGKNLEECMKEKIKGLRYRIEMTRSYLKQIDEIQKADLPPLAVLGGQQRKPPPYAAVLSPNQHLPVGIKRDESG